MTDEDRIERYLLNCGLVAKSLSAVRSDLPRWVRHLRQRGVTDIPTSPWSAGPQDTLAANLITQLVMQHPGCTNPCRTSIAHNQRNLTATRPYKP